MEYRIIARLSKIMGLKYL